MQYAEYDLVDLGFADDAGAPLASIAGRDNQSAPFHHLGYDGYPAGRVMAFDAPDKSKCLALFADGVTLPQGGTEILAADVVDLLMAEYGWPEGPRLVDGVPRGPERAL